MADDLVYQISGLPGIKIILCRNCHTHISVDPRFVSVTENNRLGFLENVDQLKVETGDGMLEATTLTSLPPDDH